MTIDEAREKGIIKVRLPQWIPGAHVILPLMKIGPRIMLGPWSEMRDPTARAPIAILTMNLGPGDDWEPFEES